MDSEAMMYKIDQDTNKQYHILLERLPQLLNKTYKKS